MGASNEEAYFGRGSWDIVHTLEVPAYLSSSTGMGGDLSILMSYSLTNCAVCYKSILEGDALDSSVSSFVYDGTNRTETRIRGA